MLLTTLCLAPQPVISRSYFYCTAASRGHPLLQNKLGRLAGRDLIQTPFAGVKGMIKSSLTILLFPVLITLITLLFVYRVAYLPAGSYRNVVFKTKSDDANSQTVDRGSVRCGEVLAHTFTITNATQSPWTISRMVKTCACLSAKISRPTLLPGESCYCELSVNAPMAEAPFASGVTLHFTDPSIPPVTLGISGDSYRAFKITKQLVEFNPVPDIPSQSVPVSVQNWTGGSWQGLSLVSAPDGVHLTNVHRDIDGTHEGNNKSTKSPSPFETWHANLIVPTSLLLPSGTYLSCDLRALQSQSDELQSGRDPVPVSDSTSPASETSTVGKGLTGTVRLKAGPLSDVTIVPSRAVVRVGVPCQVEVRTRSGIPIGNDYSVTTTIPDLDVEIVNVHKHGFTARVSGGRMAESKEGALTVECLNERLTIPVTIAD